jgi:hypothetical protein
MALYLAGTRIVLPSLPDVATLSLTFGCFYKPSVQGAERIITACQSGNNSRGWSLCSSASSPYFVEAATFTVSGDVAVGPGMTTAWQYIMAEFVDIGGGVTQMTAFRNNVAGASANSSRPVSGFPDELYFSGRNSFGSDVQPITGCVCELAVWAASGIGGSSEGDDLVAGNRASVVHPTNLLYYMPAESDLTLLVNSGSTTPVVHGATSYSLCSSSPSLEPLTPPIVGTRRPWFNIAGPVHL